MDDGERVVSAGFHERVYEVVRAVPAGRVTTYGDVAAALGSPRVARHVGWALAACRDEDVPWHRVLDARGTISSRGATTGAGSEPGDAPRTALQRSLLEAEGVTFDARGRVDLRRYRHHHPLD